MVGPGGGKTTEGSEGVRVIRFTIVEMKEHMYIHVYIYILTDLGRQRGMK